MLMVFREAEADRPTASKFNSMCDACIPELVNKFKMIS